MVSDTFNEMRSEEVVARHRMRAVWASQRKQWRQRRERRGVKENKTWQELAGGQKWAALNYLNQIVLSLPVTDDVTVLFVFSYFKCKHKDGCVKHFWLIGPRFSFSLCGFYEGVENHSPRLFLSITDWKKINNFVHSEVKRWKSRQHSLIQTL